MTDAATLSASDAVKRLATILEWYQSEEGRAHFEEKGYNVLSVFSAFMVDILHEAHNVGLKPSRVARRTFTVYGGECDEPERADISLFYDAAAAQLAKDTTAK